MSRVLLEPTAPADCVLALALPLSKQDLFDDLEQRGAKSFALSVQRRFGRNLTAEALWHAYAPNVVALQELIDLCRKSGVTISGATTLADFELLCAKYRVVTLFAHWTGSRVSADDFVAAPEAIAERILNAQDALAGKLRKHIDTAVLATPDRLSDELVRAMNKAIVSTTLSCEDPSRMYVTDEVRRAYENRRALDAWSKGSLKEGNLLELRRGLHTIGEVVNAIPRDFDGLIDFAVCDSMIIADEVKAARGCHVIMNTDKAHVPQRVLIQKYLMKLLVSGQYNYAMLLKKIHMDLARS